jgi:hypothetical protein
LCVIPKPDSEARVSAERTVGAIAHSGARIDTRRHIDRPGYTLHRNTATEKNVADMKLEPTPVVIITSPGSSRSISISLLINNNSFGIVTRNKAMEYCRE